MLEPYMRNRELLGDVSQNMDRRGILHFFYLKGKFLKGNIFQSESGVN